jgi:hypothetical protein
MMNGIPGVVVGSEEGILRNALERAADVVDYWSYRGDG